MRTYLILTVLFVVGLHTADAQFRASRVEAVPVASAVPVRPGSTVRLSLNVKMAANIHVQSDTPRDPALIPTALTITPPPGVTVKQIVFPPSTDLQQQGRGEPLAVFGGEVTVQVHLALADGVAAGDLRIPAVLRYQACDTSVCFAPAKSEIAWVVQVAPRAAP